MAGTTSARTELRWREILKRQARGGLSIRRFCLREGISEPSFYSWRKKLQQESHQDDERAPQSTRPKEAPEDVRMFVPLKLLDSTGTLEIVHPLGYRIQMSGDVNPVALRRVLEALDERGG